MRFEKIAGSIRQAMLINEGWKFCPDFTDDFVKVRCDESCFAPVTLPHTTVQLPYSGGDIRTYQKVTTYRRIVEIPGAMRGRRIQLHFHGAMAATSVYVNGRLAGEHLGGYTPFVVDITNHLNFGTENTVAVRLDSTERPDMPPFGGMIDYLTYGGLYRDVHIRAVHPTYIDRIFLIPAGVAAGKPTLTIGYRLLNAGDARFSGVIDFEIGRDAQCKASAMVEVDPGDTLNGTVEVSGASALELWDMENPTLHRVQARLHEGGRPVDEVVTRFGMREAEFTPEGFRLNGKLIKLRGLNRHQAFPWVGYAMPARVQRRDADILKHELKLNVVRSSHYPQSPHFLDRCDELGLLVLDEIPGWQHIGDAAWKDKACGNVRDMVERDFNHPSVVLWLVRINESKENDELYKRTHAIAKEIDPTRQTGGVRFSLDSNLHEDVFTVNDFDPVTLMVPAHPRHLITEFAGHMYPTKQFDNVERITEHFRRHAYIQSLVGSNPAIAGALGWCAFDYNTHDDFGSGDGICHHGVYDMFRIPKKAAALYRSQCDPHDEVVLEPAFAWAVGDLAGGGGVGEAYIGSNCDRIEVYLGDELADELFPLKDEFGGLPHPPFRLTEKTMMLWPDRWRDLRLVGYIGNQVVAERRMSCSARNADWRLVADDTELKADDADATRVWFMVTDEYGNQKPFATGAIVFEITGPAELIGDNPFSLIGGCGAVWVRAGNAPGQVALTGTHPVLGKRSVSISVAE